MLKTHLFAAFAVEMSGRSGYFSPGWRRSNQNRTTTAQFQQVPSTGNTFSEVAVVIQPLGLDYDKLPRLGNLDRPNCAATVGVESIGKAEDTGQALGEGSGRRGQAAQPGLTMAGKCTPMIPCDRGNDGQILVRPGEWPIKFFNHLLGGFVVTFLAIR